MFFLAKARENARDNPNVAHFYSFRTAAHK